VRTPLFFAGVSLVALSTGLSAQDPAAVAAAAAARAATPPPPATKLEAFKPAAGSVVTLGYSELGRVSGISVDVRELKDARASTARGLLVEVRESQYRQERSFVDADEVPDLLRGIDALLSVESNPTPFKQFEVRYLTKGELQLTAFNDSRGQIKYVIQAGRGLRAQSFIDQSEMRRFREMIATAAQQLAP
jgi:hypothetical protein